jgi:lipopolysaccharide/colanic/teichoic acid biosynthesis glycosyltransferase
MGNRGPGATGVVRTGAREHETGDFWLTMGAHSLAATGSDTSLSFDSKLRLALLVMPLLAAFGAGLQVAGATFAVSLGVVAFLQLLALAHAIARPKPRWKRLAAVARTLGVIDSELFRSSLIRERLRAERFERDFALLLVRVPDTNVLDALKVVEAVTKVRREVDLLGWFEDGTTLGLVLPETDALDVTITSPIEARLRRELVARLGSGIAGQCSIQFHAYPGSVNKNASITRSPTDPLLLSLDLPRNRGFAQEAIKRGIDIVVSAVALVLLLPFFVVIAAVIKLNSPGPAFLKHTRVGQGGRRFGMLKFRTMRVNAEEALHKEFVDQMIKGAATSRTGSKEEPPHFKLALDPRVTSVGRFLRKTSIDELPQLWNVLVGEMSLVGPRPSPAYEIEHFKPWHYRRVLEIKPGITGLWQVMGRNRTTFDDWVRLDLHYAQERSLRLDLWILFRTLTPWRIG